MEEDAVFWMPRYDSGSTTLNIEAPPSTIPHSDAVNLVQNNVSVFLTDTEAAQHPQHAFHAPAISTLFQALHVAPPPLQPPSQTIFDLFASGPQAMRFRCNDSCTANCPTTLRNVLNMFDTRGVRIAYRAPCQDKIEMQQYLDDDDKHGATDSDDGGTEKPNNKRRLATQPRSRRHKKSSLLEGATSSSRSKDKKQDVRGKRGPRASMPVLRYYTPQQEQSATTNVLHFCLERICVSERSASQFANTLLCDQIVVERNTTSEGWVVHGFARHKHRLATYGYGGEEDIFLPGELVGDILSRLRKLHTMSEWNIQLQFGVAQHSKVPSNLDTWKMQSCLSFLDDVPIALSRRAFRSMLSISGTTQQTTSFVMQRCT